ncbi:MAG: efflux RND transporter periplasmic adaptor subunit [Alphaproteobacteria bacterium]|nr:efflux RND transporter periplasmic adaptor subunit [Alphaproteobacteria bacterium]
MKKILLLIIFGLGIGGSYFLGKKTGNGSNMMMAQMMGQNMAPYVQTGKPTLHQIENNSRFIALVTPINAVDIKTQVAGDIEEVLFDDGQVVKEGDILFKIEQDRYEANVAAAKATLARAEADLKQLNNDYNRQKQLHRDKFVSTADLEKAENKLSQAKASVAQANANLQLAEIDLKHTLIRAPITGRIGQVLITKGNYVSLSSGPLARIVQTTPVKINFSLTDKEHLQMRKMLMNNELPQHKPELQIELSDKSLLPLPADQVFLDNEMDKETATMSLYAEYDNEDELLMPNNHVTVLWKSNEDFTTVLVPQTAVYSDANGAYLMRVNPDHTVVQQYIKQGQTFNNLIAVESGLGPNDTIVLAGGQKLHSGQKIQEVSTETK